MILTPLQKLLNNVGALGKITTSRMSTTSA